MAPWLIYIKERFPIPTYALLVGGFSLSGVYLTSNKFLPTPFLISFLGLMLFFAVLRLMDELKDYGKDLIAHPDRPLPRGVLEVAQVSQMIGLAVGAMILFGIVCALVNLTSGLLYLAITGYVWLMYKEFYVGEWLASKSALYGFTHQLIIVLLCLFTATIVNPATFSLPGTWFYGFAILGSFFSYEVSRKLDPKAHPLLKTYLQAYGPKGTLFFVLCTSLVAFIFDYLLGLAPLLWPFQILIVLSLPLLILRPDKFKIVENLTVLGLLFHLWGIPLQHLLGWPK